MRTLGLEVRHACRSILKRPAMSAIVVVTLALGLGANAAVFEMIDALVLRPFTMPDADRITLLAYSRAEDIYPQESVSPADFLDIKRQQPDTFERLAAWQFWNANLVGQDEPENVQGFFVTADFFPVLGVQPIAGRNFLPEEETRGQHRRVVLGHGLWQRRFASDASIVGRSIEVDGTPHEVVGIAPPGFDFPMGTQLWAPLSFTAETAANRRSQYLTLIGRLAPGRTLEEAQAQMATVGERLSREYQETNKGREVRVYTIADGMMDAGLGPILSMWLASASFVLLIACANVASLLLARGAERQREMAVRLAIGASRARVVRELLIESGLLALAAVPGALATAWLGLKLIVGYMPAKIARFVNGWHNMDVDLRLIAFTSALAVIAALVFGLIPALQASRARLSETLKEGGRSATAGGARLRLRRVLVIGEIALVLPLLVAASLSVVTVDRFLNGPQGFNPEGLLTMRLLLPEARYENDAARRTFAEAAVERLRNIPGVDSAAAINIMPASNNNSGRSIEIEGVPNPDPSNPPSADYRTATPAIFEALQTPIRAGRAFTDADREDTQPVVIVSESLARRHWPNSEPLGKRMRTGTDQPWLTVVGVAGDHIHGWFDKRNAPTLYRPFRQAPTGGIALVVRTSREPSSVAAEARAAVRAVDPAQPVFELQSMRKTLLERTIGLQYVGAIMLVFGGLALLLAVVGVYGVMAYMVAQRTHEIGVRMALGASRRDVLLLTVGQTGRLTVVGVGLGIVGSVLLSRLIEAALFGLASNDARITGGLAVILIASSLLAGYLPARRAASIDPTAALRGE
jgi:putative ABC transport system permease protein